VRLSYAMEWIMIAMGLLMMAQRAKPTTDSDGGDDYGDFRKQVRIFCNLQLCNSHERCNECEWHYLSTPHQMCDGKINNCERYY